MVAIIGRAFAGFFLKGCLLGRGGAAFSVAVPPMHGAGREHEKKNRG
jgi:hypothetical protein